MSEKYPYKCCRCGYCCLAEACPAAIFYFGIKKHARCPALTITGNITTCTISHMITGIGEGCCMKARAIKDGVTYDFAALPASFKFGAVNDLIRRRAAGK